MTTYTAIPDSDIDPESPGTTTLFTRLRDNPIAITEGSTGAPKIQQAAIENQAVNVSKLERTSGTVSVACSSGTYYTGVLAGGDFAFRVRTRWSSTTGLLYFEGYTDRSPNTSFASPQLQFNVNTATTAYGREYYVQTSPPYDLGDGEIGLFVFALIDNGTGRIEKTYAAPEAPWHNNGPTSIAVDYYDENKRGWRKSKGGLIEITQEVKQADMPLIPHPFITDDLTGKTVVLLDPVADSTWGLFERHEEGDCISEMLHEGHLIVDNSGLVRNGPPGVIAVSHKFKATR